jgi:hypothetical protein
MHHNFPKHLTKNLPCVPTKRIFLCWNTNTIGCIEQAATICPVYIELSQAIRTKQILSCPSQGMALQTKQDCRFVTSMIGPFLSFSLSISHFLSLQRFTVASPHGNQSFSNNVHGHQQDPRIRSLRKRFGKEFSLFSSRKTVIS